MRTRTGRSQSMTFPHRGRCVDPDGKYVCFSRFFGKVKEHLDPSAYVAFLPIVPIPSENWMDMHVIASKKHVGDSIAVLERLLRDLDTKTAPLKNSAERLIVKKGELQTMIEKFKGKGLKENRNTFFLMDLLLKLRIKLHSLILNDSDCRYQYYEAMSQYLKTPRNYALSYVSVNLRGFVNDIPNNQDKIDEIEAKIAFLEKHIKKPTIMKPPEELLEQLVYPTSTTGIIFHRLEKDVSNNRFDLILREFKQLTDDPLEMDILIDIAFEFAWRNTKWPFCEPFPMTFPTFKDVKLEVFDIPYLEAKWQQMRIEELVVSDWPFSSVVEMLTDLYFMINPMEMCRLCYRAMGEAGKCVLKIAGDFVEIDFDTIFPIMMVCFIVSGIPQEPMIMWFASSLGKLHKDDSYCQVGASYMEAMIAHIANLKEAEMINKTRI